MNWLGLLFILFIVLGIFVGYKLADLEDRFGHTGHF